MAAYKVILDGKEISTVFYGAGVTLPEIKEQLVMRGEFPAGITLRRDRKYKRSTPEACARKPDLVT